MRSTLCEAVARCHLRRLRGVAAAAPLPAAIVALVVVAAPFVLFRLGGAVGAEVADSIGDAGVSDGARARTAAGGRRRGRSARGRGAGAIGARESGRRRPSRAPAIAVVALALVPAAAGSIVVVPSLVAVCVGLARALPGGAAAGVALAAATLAAVPAGAVVAEGGLAAGRAAAPPRARPSVSGCWAGSRSGSLSELPRSGRSRSCRAALRGAGSPWLALGVSSGVGIGLAAAWVALAATRAEPRSRRRAVGALRPTTPAGADCRGRAARAEGRSEARDARCGRLRPRRSGACGRDRRASAGTVPARHDDGLARVAPVPTRRRRRARRRPLALAERTRPERRDRAVVRAREHRRGRASRSRSSAASPLSPRVRAPGSSASSRRSSSSARAWRCSPARCSRGAAREPEIS